MYVLSYDYVSNASTKYFSRFLSTLSVPIFELRGKGSREEAV